MNATTHTAGPWCFDAEAGFVTTSAGDTVAVVCFHATDKPAQEDANGRLIAAAPELLRCAEMALEELQEYGRFNPLARVAIRALQAVITAATGTTTTEQTGGAA
jgi:hypothetical protein